MKAKRFGRTRLVARISAGALLAGALAFAATVHATNRSARLPKVILTSASDFTITGTITGWPTCPSVPAASLYPGTERCLTYTVHNPLQVPISVLSLSAAFDSTVTTTVPAACTLDLGDASLTGTHVDPLLTVPAGDAAMKSAPIRLTDNGHNQDVCKGFTFALKYSGSAFYTESYSTSTAVTSSVNPSNVGQSVTYTATVTGIQGAAQDPMPNSPTGSVTFQDGATTICAANIPVTSATATTSTAQCTPTPAYATGATHPITAVFTHAVDLNFEDSTSAPVLNQVVQSSLPATSTVLTSSPNPSILGSSVTLTAKVTKSSGSGTPAGTVAFYKGTPPTGTLLGTGTLNGSGVATLSTSGLPAGADSLYAVYSGDASFATSASPVITQIVIAKPAACVDSSNLIVANPASPVVNGTNGNDFIYAVGATSYKIDGRNGNDCIQAGDGNNRIVDGNGDDVVIAGNGTNTITVGNGNVTIVAGNGTNTIAAGNGNDTVTIGNGSDNRIALGNANNTVTVGTGATNIVTAGNGNNTFRILTPGNHDTFSVGNGKNVIYMGGGTFNKFSGGKAGNTCHLPSLPASTYSDTLTNCTAVTP